MKIIHLYESVASLMDYSRSLGDSLPRLGSLNSSADYLTSGRGASPRGCFPALPTPHPQTTVHLNPPLQREQV